MRSRRLTRILAGGGALERCAGFGRTADGRLDVAGRAGGSEATDAWKLAGESDADRGADGTVLVCGISDREWPITATVTPRAGTVLRSAVVVHPAADASFIALACERRTRASGQLAALPSFPFPTSVRSIPIPGCCLSSARSSPAPVTGPSAPIVPLADARAGRTAPGRVT